MTNEELYKAAEDRFNKHCAEDYCYPSRPDLELYKDGYKDGCEQGMKKVLLCIEIDGDFKVYIEGLYDKGECLEEYDSCWLYHEADKKVLTEIIDNQKVIAWCELPKFEE